MTHTKIDEWFYARGIAQNGTQLGQASKMLEEVAEVFDALSSNDRVALTDAIGDVYVTLRGLALVSNLDFDTCVEHAYNEIKDRVGYLREDGVFMKQNSNGVVMREIKFRAWGGQKMYSPSIEGCCDISEYLSDMANIMQYTGLKDKNGVEIYEGDIVSIVYCEPSLYKIVWWENNFKYGVEYIGTDITNWKEEGLEEFNSDLIEVVGNIYENPELLEDN